MIDRAVGLMPVIIPHDLWRKFSPHSLTTEAIIVSIVGSSKDSPESIDHAGTITVRLPENGCETTFAD